MVSRYVPAYRPAPPGHLDLGGTRSMGYVVVVEAHTVFALSIYS